MTEKIAILSGKGGVGKTFTALNLAAAINSYNRDVILVDANITTPNIGIHLGSPKVPITLHDVLRGYHHITEAVYSHASGIKVIPGSLSNKSLHGLKLNNLRKSLYALEGLTDYIIIDGAPGLTNENASLLESVSSVLIVTNPELPALSDALKMIKMVEAYGRKIKGIVVTKTGKDDNITIDNIEKLLGKKVIAEIPDDKKVKEALEKKNIFFTLHPTHKVSLSYKKLAALLLNEQYKEEKVKNFFSNMFKGSKSKNL